MLYPTGAQPSPIHGDQPLTACACSAIDHCSETDASSGRPEPPYACHDDGRNWNRPPAPLDELTALGSPPLSWAMMHDQIDDELPDAAGVLDVADDGTEALADACCDAA